MVVDAKEFEETEQETEEEKEESQGQWEEPGETLDIDVLIDSAGEVASIGLGPKSTAEIKDKFRGLAENVCKVVDLEDATRGMTVKDRISRRWRLGVGFGTILLGPFLARGFYNYQQDRETVDVENEESSGEDFSTEEEDVEDL